MKFDILSTLEFFIAAPELSLGEQLLVLKLKMSSFEHFSHWFV
jgi:hypothetical protein